MKKKANFQFAYARLICGIRSVSLANELIPKYSSSQLGDLVTIGIINWRSVFEHNRLMHFNHHIIIGDS